MSDTLPFELIAPTASNLAAEAAMFKAQEDKAIMEANLARFAYLAAEREERRLSGTFEQKRIWYITDSIGSSSTRVCMDRLHQWHEEDPTCDMEVWLTSPGGGVTSGMALFDYIQYLAGAGHKITTVAMGMAASMAAILMQAGSWRVMGRETFLLVHEVSWGAEGKVGELEDATKWMEKVCDRVVNLFVKRSGGKITKAAFKTGWTRKDWWLDSDEALRLGFVDEVR